MEDSWDRESDIENSELEDTEKGGGVLTGRGMASGRPGEAGGWWDRGRWCDLGGRAGKHADWVRWWCGVKPRPGAGPDTGHEARDKLSGESTASPGPDTEPPCRISDQTSRPAPCSL